MKTVSFRDHLKESLKDDEFKKIYLEERAKLKIGEMLKRERKKLKLTLKKLAEKMHTTVSALSRLENHPENVKIDTLIKYSVALGKTLHIDFK